MFYVLISDRMQRRVAVYNINLVVFQLREERNYFLAVLYLVRANVCADCVFGIELSFQVKVKGWIGVSKVHYGSYWLFKVEFVLATHAAV